MFSVCRCVKVTATVSALCSGLYSEAWGFCPERKHHICLLRVAAAFLLLVEPGEN